jgi:hypothetical protein
VTGTLTVGGNVGIGTQRPAELLEVNGRIKSGALTIGLWPANPNRYTFFGTNALDQADPRNYALLQAAADVDKGVTYLNSPVSIHFRIGNAEKMALANNGNVGIGTMEPAAPLHVASYIAVGPFAATIGRDGIDVTGGGGKIGLVDRRLASWPANPQPGHRFVWYNIDRIARLWADASASGDVLTVTSDGNLAVKGSASKPGGGPWADLSDRQLKTNIQPLTGALATLLRLRGVCFEWLEPAQHGNLTGPQIGMIAQEVETVLPDWVSTTPEGYKLLAIRGFEALTVEAFREVQAEHTALQAQHGALEARVKQLEAQVRAQRPMAVNHRKGAV